MQELNKKSQKALDDPEVLAAAQLLAKYGLGICVPHLHTDAGQIQPLPSGFVAAERSLRVSFERTGDLEDSMIPVAWRWSDNGIEICGSCCSAGPEVS